MRVTCSQLSSIQRSTYQGSRVTRTFEEYVVPPVPVWWILGIKNENVLMDARSVLKDGKDSIDLLILQKVRTSGILLVLTKS